MTGTFDVTRIPVAGDSAYDVLVGHGLHADLDLLHGLLGDRALRVAVVHPRPLEQLAHELGEGLRARGLVPLLLAVPDGEAAKDVSVAAQAWSSLGRAGFTRTDAVVGLGGGATTDLAGFVAATWLRGVPVVHLPTTLLGMVDAAIGGKTGINTPEGKNLVGVFHPPAGVLCDLAVLGSLPVPDLVSGMAEIVKAGFIVDDEILALIEQDPVMARTPGSATLRQIVERAIRVKADVVSGDLREHGGREILNYGHTLGHAIEKVEGYRWRHGDAVSVGMVYAAEVARAAGFLSDDDVQRHREILSALGLPTRYRGDRWHELIEAMQVDKKTRAATLRFVVLDGIGRPTILENPAPDWLTSAYERVAA